jgi:hypothetical protein
MTEKSSLEGTTTTDLEVVKAHLADFLKEIAGAKKKLREFTKTDQERNPHPRITWEGDLSDQDLDILNDQADWEFQLDLYPEDKTIYFLEDEDAQEFMKKFAPLLSVRCSIGYPAAKDSEG